MGQLYILCRVVECPGAHVMVIHCWVTKHCESYWVQIASDIYFKHKSSVWVGLHGDNLYAALGDRWGGHAAGRRGAVIVWRLPLTCLVIGEVLIGSDGQDLHVPFLHGYLASL